MKNSDFTTTIVTEKSAKETFDAICNVKGWWQGEVKGKSKKLNDEFEYRMEDIHFSRQKLIEVIPDKKIAWLITESQLNFTKDKSEWTGTKVIFEIAEVKNKTQVTFTHSGLVPEFECYEACSNAWGQLVQKSLLSLINTGKGKKVF